MKKCKIRSILQALLSMIVLYLTISPVCGQDLSQPESIMNQKHKEFSKWKYGMFLHFNMGTYVNKEWATGYEDPLLFNPTKLDCRQWAKVIKSSGMNYAILTVKHTCGWCLWDSKYTTHDMTAFKNFKNGKGDIVREFVDACRKEKVKVGLYYCLPGDFSGPNGKSLSAGQKDLHGLPLEAEGDFEGFIEKQVTELMSNYGKIDLIWFDQFPNKYTGQKWLQLKALVYKLQPNCIVVGNNANNFKDSDILGYEYPWRLNKDPKNAVPPEGNKDVSELCDCIDAGGRWFWHTGDIKLQSVDKLVKMIKLCNSRATNYLLDVPPGRDGLIDSVYIKQLQLVKKEVGF